MELLIQDIPFPTQITPLINARGLSDSASLENYHNNRRNSASHMWPKTFLGAVYARAPMNIGNHTLRLSYYLCQLVRNNILLQRHGDIIREGKMKNTRNL